VILRYAGKKTPATQDDRACERTTGRPFFAYVLRCSDLSYYVGHTDDLPKRLAEHPAGGKCAYTTARRPVQLVWSQEFSAREEAKDAEIRVKAWSRRKKEALIRGDTNGLRTAARKDWSSYRARKAHTDNPE
jgi:predicted GIY-YIG superfamily endonuclease